MDLKFCVLCLVAAFCLALFVMAAVIISVFTVSKIHRGKYHPPVSQAEVTTRGGRRAK